MCLCFFYAPHSNIVSADVDDDDVPFRQAATIPCLKRRVAVIALNVPYHNNVSVRGNKANYSDVKVDMDSVDSNYSISKGGLGVFNKWLKKGVADQKMGYVVSEKPVDNSQRWTIDAASPEEKLKELKLRLGEAKVDFQESMDRLNEQLVLVKDI